MACAYGPIDHPGQSFRPSWGSHPICWDYEPRDFIPKGDLKHYSDLLDLNLLCILEQGHALRRGHPIEGVLCGYSYQPVPELGDPVAYGTLALVDDIGNRLELRIKMTIVRAARCETPARSRRFQTSPLKLTEAEKSRATLGPQAEVSLGGVGG